MSKAERWQEVEALVAQTMELSGDEREAVLDAADPEIATEARQLLAARTAAEGFLEQPAGSFSADGLDLTDPLIGTSIGPYRIEALLGRGGMGAVYLGSRADEAYHQRVAVKVLRPRAAGADLARRFHTERQILASLEHPNIARLLDGGTTDDGLPYLVMELVEGVPIDRYCEERKLSLRDRVRLLVKVCDAVSFAHRSLVVHRDLKPGNILVTGSGEPKLLDFGIAKLLDPSSLDLRDETTRQGLRPMSPSYASPEHIRGQAITTASDVYSLGVLLYLLLSGELPRSYEDLSVAGMERELGREPTAPSTVVGRQNTPRAVRTRRLLAGDLDAITLKALRDEPQHRYPSVSELASDLRRLLGGLPVEARRGGFAYRAGKMLRRHAFAAGAVAVLLALAVTFTTTVVLQQRRTVYERDRATRIADFMVSIFEESSPDLSGDATMSSREVLDRGARRIENEFADFPETQADLLLTVGRVYCHLSIFDEAASLLRRCVDLRRGLGPSQRHELPEALNELAYALIELGEPEEAKQVLDEALAIGEAELDELHNERIATLKLLGQHHWRLDNNEEAAAYHRRTLTLTERACGPGDPQLASAQGGLAMVLSELSEWEEAEQLYLQAIGTLEKTQPPLAAEMATALANVGSLYWETGRLDLAAEHLERSLAIHQQITSPDDPTLATNLNNLALVQADRGELEQAATMFRRSLELKLQGLKPTSPAVLASRNNLASVLADLGELEPARTEWLLTLEGCRLVFAGDSRRTAVVLRCLADLEHRLGRDQEAARYIDESVEMAARVLAPDHPTHLWILQSLAQINLGTGVMGDAERLLRQVTSVEDESSKDLQLQKRQALAMSCLAEILLVTKRLDEAARELDRAEAMLAPLIENEPTPALNQLSVRMQLTRGDLQRALGDINKARSTWQQALELLENDPQPSIDADHRLLRIAALLRLGRPGQARADAEHLIGLGWTRPEWIELALIDEVRPEDVPVVLY